MRQFYYYNIHLPLRSLPLYGIVFNNISLLNIHRYDKVHLSSGSELMVGPCNSQWPRLWPWPWDMTLLLVGSAWQLSHPPNGCNVLIFQVSIFGLTCKYYKRSKVTFLLLFKGRKGRISPLCWLLSLEWCQYVGHIVYSHCSTCLFGIILNSKPYHVPL